MDSYPVQPASTLSVAASEASRSPSFGVLQSTIQRQQQYVVHKGSHITVGYRTVPSGTVRHPRVPLSALLSLLYSALLYIKKKGTSSSVANFPICFADVAIAFAKSFPFNSVHQTARNCANLSICFADVAEAFAKAIPYNSVHQTA